MGDTYLGVAEESLKLWEKAKSAENKLVIKEKAVADKQKLITVRKENDDEKRVARIMRGNHTMSVLRPRLKVQTTNSNHDRPMLYDFLKLNLLP